MANNRDMIERLKYASPKTLTVLVGQGARQQSFTVHRDLITKRSEVFATVTSDRVPLQDFDPELFDKYLHCVYRNRAPKAALAPCEGGRMRPDAIVDQKNTDTQFEALLSLYVLANHLEDPATANLVIAEIRRFCGPSKLPPGPKMVDLAFRSTVERDRLRNLLVDLYIYGSRTPPNAHCKFPRGEFSLDFLYLFMESVLTEKLKKTYREDIEALGGNPAGSKSQYDQSVRFPEY